MFVGVLKVEVYMESNRSLKDKRQLVRSLKGKIKSRFTNVSVSEVDSFDFWKKATLGFTVVGSDYSMVNSYLDQILDFIRSRGFFHIINSYSDIVRF